MKPLIPQPTIENPYVVADYPWGFHYKTQCRFYVETDPKKGDREVNQTQDPKTGRWCNPKKSTYTQVILLGIDEENGHAERMFDLSYWNDEEKHIERLRQIQELKIPLNEHQQNQIKELNAINKTRKYLSFQVVETTHQTPEEREQHDRKQAEIKRKLAFIHNRNRQEAGLQ